MTDKELDDILNEFKSKQDNVKNEESPKVQEPAKEAPKPELTPEPKAEVTEDAFDLKNEDAKPNDVDSDLVFANDLNEHKNDVYFSDYSDEYSEEPEGKKKKSKKKKTIIAIIAILVVAAIGVGVYFGFFYNKADETPVEETTVEEVTETTTLADMNINPLTGETGFNTAYQNKRPVAIVVENEYSTEAVKPQWGIDQADILLEGESEFSTRLLMFWADYSKVPAQVGPTRSARPPFIRFSELFNSIFIHAGLSSTSGNYVGADTVFEDDNVDHINLLSFSESGTYFGRDKTRTTVIEHTGYLNGKNLEALLADQKIDTTLNKSKFTTLKFNTEAKALSSNTASRIEFKWSTNCPKKGVYTYNGTTKKYTTTDFDSKYGESNVAWENLIFLLDNTQYVVKENYGGSGSSETYCNYDLSGGKGVVCSQGTSIDITWGVSDGKLWMKDSSGQDVTLNPGKSYIGYGSSNHGGSITVNSDN